MNKIQLSFFVLLLHCIPIEGQNIPVQDVDSLGDIWIVTIDNTFSMHSRHGKPVDMLAAGKGVESRLLKSKAFDKVNWDNDRFLILKSGIREGRRAKFIDTEFIKHTDGQLHKYYNKNQFACQMGEIITNSDYSNYMSFVSQMRLLSLCTALDYISQHNMQKDYRGIKILTISDDAVDQHDQWSTDYRTLKECAPDKVEYLSGLARRYIFNPLNGWGGGDMILEWSDDTRLPHIWMYQYVTAEGRRVKDTTGIYVDVKAADGHKLEFQLKSAEPMPCLCRIDSVNVNGNTIVVERYFTDKLDVESDYKNDAFTNEVTVYGKAQIDYTDSILGEHYRMIDFVQHSKAMPKHLSTTLNILVLLLISAVVMALLFVLWLWPRKVLFEVYDASGRQHRVRRGYRWQWSGNMVPLLTLFVGKRGQTIVLSRQDTKVETKQYVDNLSVDENDRVLIVSRHRISLSVNSINHNSGSDDIENYYNLQQDYPQLLKMCYRKSPEFRYYKMQHSTNRLERFAGKFLLRVKVFLFGAVWYNYYRQDENVVSVESSALAGKLFLIEKRNIPRGFNESNYQGKLEERGECYIRKHLLEFFTAMGNPDVAKNSDVILMLSQSSGQRIWDVVLTSQARKGQVSLYNITWVYHYTLPGVEDWTAIQWEYKAMMRFLQQTYHRRVAFVSHLNWNAESHLAMACFDIEKFNSRRFLSLVSTEVEPVVTPMYDPFRDGQNSSKQFMIKSDNDNLRSINHLYCSFLPFDLLPKNNYSQYEKKLSDNLIPFSGKKQAVILEIEDEQTYRIHGTNITINQK